MSLFNVVYLKHFTLLALLFLLFLVSDLIFCFLLKLKIRFKLIATHGRHLNFDLRLI